MDLPGQSPGKDDEELVQPCVKGGIGGIHHRPGRRHFSVPGLRGLSQIYGGNHIWVATVIYGGQDQSHGRQSDLAGGDGRQGDGGVVGRGISAYRWEVRLDLSKWGYFEGG